MIDPYADAALLRHEVAQRRESGYDVPDDVAATILDHDGEMEPDLADSLWAALDATTRRADWSYDEPSVLAEIEATLPGGDPEPFGPVRAGELNDRLLGAWLGRCAANNLGKPVEDGTKWDRALIPEYLILADAYPIEDYIPLLDPVPERFVLRETWPVTTRGNVDGVVRDDDLDYTILGLHLLETYGAGLTASDVGREWLDRLPYTQTYTAERVSYRSLVNGLAADLAAEHRNPYREWIGAAIRGDIFGYAHPGRPRQAALAAHADAWLSHRANGIYGEMWAAAIVSVAFTAPTVRDAVVESARHLPPRSRLAEALGWIVGRYDAGVAWDDVMDEIDERFGHYHWVHTINNAMILAAGLLWGEGDFTRTAALTVMGALDTDSNGATAGSVAGALLGAHRLPTHWIDPLHDRMSSSIRGFDGSRISALAARTARLSAS